jgi:hypothetical protein
MPFHVDRQETVTMSEDNTTPEVKTFSVDGLDDAAVLDAYNSARTRGAELFAKSDRSAAETAEMQELATRIDVAGNRLDEITEQAASVAAAAEKFGSAPDRSLPAPVVAVSAPVTASEVAPVSQSVEVPSVSEMAVQDRTVIQPTEVVKAGDKVTVRASTTAAGLLGLRSSDVLTDGQDVAVALIKNAESFGLKGAPGTRQTIAQFHRDRGEEFTVRTENVSETNAIIRAARDEKKRFAGSNLAQTWLKSIEDGASLTAAAGWCAPSQNDYSLCRNWDAPVGLIDLPTVTVTRGGINYTDEPDFPTIYANAIAAGGGSNFLTEAQVIADTPKTCSEIPCPTFENRRLDVMALCIRVSFLQAAGYPEVVAAWDAGLRAAHEAEMNRLIIADIIARAGAATVLPGTSPDPDGGDSFTSSLLAGVELAAEDIRYRFHMAFNSTVEIVLPHWVLPQMRADISRRSGWNGLGISEGEIASWFAVRNVRVQFVRGWQDGLITAVAAPTFPGADATAPFLTTLPTTVSFLAFPAGSVAVARQDVVTLTNVYDAASLATNEFTALFAEEGFAPIYPCPGQRLYTVTGCTAGIAGANRLDCAAVGA